MSHSPLASHPFCMTLRPPHSLLPLQRLRDLWEEEIHPKAAAGGGAGAPTAGAAGAGAPSARARSARAAAERDARDAAFASWLESFYQLEVEAAQEVRTRAPLGRPPRTGCCGCGECYHFINFADLGTTCVGGVRGCPPLHFACLRDALALSERWAGRGREGPGLRNECRLIPSQRAHRVHVYCGCVEDPRRQRFFS